MYNSAIIRLLNNKGLKQKSNNLSEFWVIIVSLADNEHWKVNIIRKEWKSTWEIDITVAMPKKDV